MQSLGQIFEALCQCSCVFASQSWAVLCLLLFDAQPDLAAVLLLTTRTVCVNILLVVISEGENKQKIYWSCSCKISIFLGFVTINNDDRA